MLHRLRSQYYYVKTDGYSTKYFINETITYPEYPYEAGDSITYIRLSWHYPLKLKEQKIQLPSVISNENGENTYGYIYEYFDTEGRKIWQKDAIGAVSYTEYNRYSSQITKEIRDYDTEVNPEGLEIPEDFHTTSTNPLNLKTEYFLDDSLRVNKIKDPNNRRTYFLYTKLFGGEDVKITLPHLYKPNDPDPLPPDVTGSLPESAVFIEVSFQLGPVRTIAYGQLKSTINEDNLLPNSYPTTLWDWTKTNIVDAFIGGNDDKKLLKRTEDIYENGLRIKFKRFIDASNKNSLTYDTTYGYDDVGNLIRIQDPIGDGGGTITKYTYNFLNRHSTTWIGTDDGSSGDMVKTETRYYDEEEHDPQPSYIGDGNLTMLVKHVDSNPDQSNARVTEYSYDYSQLGKIHQITYPSGPIELYWYDGAGQLIEKELCKGAPPNLLQARTKTFYDSRGNIYEERQIAVNPLNGSTNEAGGDYNNARYWRNQRGDLIKIKGNGGVFEKYLYNGAGRQIRKTISWDENETTYAQAVDPQLGNDVVINQDEFVYDKSGNVTISKRLERDSNYSYFNGQNPINRGLLPYGDETKARGSFIAMWYDSASRKTDSANYGNNGNSSDLTRPTNPPTYSSDEVIITNMTYYPIGQLENIYKPKADNNPSGTKVKNSYSYDDLGRLIQKIENDGGTAPWSNRKTEYIYTPIDKIKTITASTAGAYPYSPGPEPQVTSCTYGVTVGQFGVTKIASNRLIYQIEYPRSDAEQDQDNYGYNAQGEVIFKQDSSQIIHTYDYTKEGKIRSDVASNIDANNFDTSIKSIWWNYDDIGRMQKVTSRAGTDESTNAVNGVMFEYEKYGLPSKFYQNVSGLATTSSPKVSYTYNYPNAGGVPGLRLSQTTYPNGFILNEVYTASSTDYYINRPTGRAIPSGTTFFTNDYLGLNKVLTRKNPSIYPNINLELELDRFARISTLKVKKLPLTLYNSYEYSYNLGSQMVLKKELASALQIFHEMAGYNDLSMMNMFKRGEYDEEEGDIINFSYRETWPSDTIPPSLDHSGNWQNWNIEIPTPLTNHTQEFNDSNEITKRDTDTTFATYDNNGNSRTLWNLKYKYDAWNRLKEVKGYKPYYSYQLLAFKYNGLNQKIEKAQYYDSNGKNYYYGLDGRVLEERNATGQYAGQTKNLFVWGTRYIDELVSKGTYNYGYLTWVYYMQDANFNTITTIDSSGNVLYRYIYTGYGKPTQLSSSWGSSSITEDLYLFTGREYHQIVGIYDYRNRFYDPNLGRFLQRDPIGIWGDGINYGNGYGYVGNDPLNKRDPWGLFRSYHPIKSNIHKEITEEALKGSGLSQACINRICAANTAQDTKGYPNSPPYTDSLNHADNSMIYETLQRIREWENQIRNWTCGSTGCDDVWGILDILGMMFHAIQDFYSHSNYVEEMDEHYNSGISGVNDPDLIGPQLPTIPTFHFSGSRESLGWITSGTYPDVGTPFDHENMNKDSPESLEGSARNDALTSLHNLARDLAVRSTKEAYYYIDSSNSVCWRKIKNCCKK